jgi:stage IV sporulation protein B
VRFLPGIRPIKCFIVRPKASFSANTLCAERGVILRIKKSVKRTVGIALACALAFTAFGGSGSVSAADDAIPSVEELPDMLVPVGHTVGIKLFADGVMVVGLSNINTGGASFSPAKLGGIREGDLITHIGSEKITSTEQVIELVSKCGGSGLNVRYKRAGHESQTKIEPVKSENDGVYRIGAWIRDSMGGIGTVTFYDPESGVFGALGHGINDVDTSILMPLQKGSIMHSTVSAVRKGSAGAPGGLEGSFNLLKDAGTLYLNSDCGIFGIMEPGAAWEGSAIPVASGKDVRKGSAIILANIEDDIVGEYTIEIEKVDLYNKDSYRNYSIVITDEKLLSKTGGIVQGMSGCPIIQDGMIIGAVTHVMVNDPTRGYGIFIGNMLDTAFKTAGRAAG